MKRSPALALAFAGVSLLLGGPALAQDAAAQRRAAQALRKCEANVGARLGTIEKTYHPALASKGPEGVKAWFARKDLEVARWYLYQAEGWKGLENAACAPSVRETPQFQALEERWKRAEALVQELERAKGVSFDGVRQPNTIVYNDIATGAPVARADRY